MKIELRRRVLSRSIVLGISWSAFVRSSERMNAGQVERRLSSETDTSLVLPADNRYVMLVSIKVVTLALFSGALVALSAEFPILAAVLYFFAFRAEGEYRTECQRRGVRESVFSLMIQASAVAGVLLSLAIAVLKP